MVQWRSLHGGSQTRMQGSSSGLPRKAAGIPRNPAWSCSSFPLRARMPGRSSDVTATSQQVAGIFRMRS